MISSTLGAPLGGTTVGGQNGFDSSAPRLITPPNGGGGAGRYLPSVVVVALGEPGTPVVCCARAEPTLIVAKTDADNNNLPAAIEWSASLYRRMIGYLFHLSQHGTQIHSALCKIGRCGFANTVWPMVPNASHWTDWCLTASAWH
jgi:hypothetical protein